MTGEVEQLLRRGREELRAAHVLLDAGLPSQALSRAFGRRVVRDGGLDHEVGRGLRRLFDDRDYVDYRLGEAPPEEARAAIGDAERLLDATAKWIDVRFAAA